MFLEKFPVEDMEQIIYGYIIYNEIQSYKTFTEEISPVKRNTKDKVCFKAFRGVKFSQQ